MTDRKNKLQQILSPNENDEGTWIHQDAWFHMSDLDEGKNLTYNVKKKGNGVYCFILEGDVNINGQDLNRRDGLGISNTESFEIKALSNTQILLMEIPMTV